MRVRGSMWRVDREGREGHGSAREAGCVPRKVILGLGSRVRFVFGGVVIPQVMTGFAPREAILGLDVRLPGNRN